MKAEGTLMRMLQSPVDGSALRVMDDGPAMVDSAGTVFPVVNGIPVLIDDRQSIFRTADYTSSGTSTPMVKRGWKPRLGSALSAFMARTKPGITVNLSSKRNYQRLFREVAGASPSPIVLIVGAGEQDGDGLDTASRHGIRFVKTDVAATAYVDVVCDAHQLPFVDGVFDAVVVQAVLEHVSDPARCVAEIHRVLKPDGLVYSETPFMQQVHLGRYDFTRFTHVGHRRLFRSFTELGSGVTCGPATALAWSIRYFIRSFFRPSFLQSAVDWLATFFYFWVKYLDYLLPSRPGAFDASSAYYFIGRKADGALHDREVVKGYRGLMA